MRIGAIDIGTNTVLLLIADVEDDGILRPVAHEQRFPRVGRDVDARGAIHQEAVDRLTSVLEEYARLLKEYRTERIIARATSAVRDAANRQEVIDAVYRRSGIIMESISGEVEALMTYRGAVSGISETGKPRAVIDIGGGSTELSYPRPPDGEIHRISLSIGSVRLTERYFRHDPPTTDEIDDARRAAEVHLQSVTDFNASRLALIGVAGTATTLACLDQGLLRFDIGRVAGYSMTRESVGKWLASLSGMTARAIRGLSDTAEGREDILTAGVLILHTAMSILAIERFIVSERGLRYGLVLMEWEKVRQGLRPGTHRPDQ